MPTAWDRIKHLHNGKRQKPTGQPGWCYMGCLLTSLLGDWTHPEGLHERRLSEKSMPVPS